MNKKISSILEKIIKNAQRTVKPVVKIVSVPVLTLVLLLASYHIYYLQKVYPGVFVAGTDLSGKTLIQAQEKLGEFAPPNKLEVAAQNQTFSISLDQINFEYDVDKSAKEAYQFGRAEGLTKSLEERWIAATKGVKLPLAYGLNDKALDEFIAGIASQINIPAIEPSISLQNNKIVINPGKDGQSVDQEELKKRIQQALSHNETNLVSAPITQITPRLSGEEVEDLRREGENLLGKSISIKFEYNTYTYTDKDLITLLEPPHSDGGLKEDKIATLAETLASGVNRPPQNARFVFEEGKVKEFEVAKDGVEVEKEKLIQEISRSLRELATREQKNITFNLPVKTTKPEIYTEEANNLGIKELIGRGESSFRHSIASRVHNITLAATHLNGVLIKPGEEFSFDKALGEVSKTTGYQEAFVIKEGRTILDDGGGVCQVSTTFFRAALGSGLPILERHAHSYRVSYYEQGTKAGIDATVYPPFVDLKVKNDTPAYILVVSRLDLKNSKLAFEFYGSMDGRVATISTPRLWDFQPAPPDLYQDDPTLPVGSLKQIEHAIGGAKASFDYKVTRGGETLQNRTFYSNYRPWQAVYLRGTAPN